MVTPQLIERKDSRITEDRRYDEYEAISIAIENCDEKTLKKITSILKSAGLLPLQTRQQA